MMRDPKEKVRAKCYSCNADCWFYPNVISPTLPGGKPLPFCPECNRKYFSENVCLAKMPPKYQPPEGTE